MNLRLSSNSVRIRVTEEELQTLLRGNELIDTIVFSNEQAFRYGVQIRAQAQQDSHERELACTKASDSLMLQVSREALAKLQSMPKSKDLGIYVDSPKSSGQSIDLSLEVDIRSVKQRSSHDLNRPANRESRLLNE